MLEDILVPITVFATIFGIVFVVISARNRERMAMIEKGVDPKDFLKGKGSVYNVLKWALLLVGLGVGALVGGLLATYTQIGEEAAYPASILLFGGLGLFVAFLISRNAKEE